MSDIQPTQPAGSTPDPSTTPDSSTTDPSTTSSTDPTSKTSKKEASKEETYSNIEAVFMNSPYVQENPTVEAALSDPKNEDKILQGVQTYAKQSHKNKQELEDSQQKAKDAISAYDTEAPDTTQTSKNKGE